jgi:hypothetical protein
MKEIKFKGRHSIDNLLHYKIESYHVWQDVNNNDKIFQGIISGKWKSGTRFHNCNFTITYIEWNQLKSLHRDKKLNQILS